jgi:hypothetical protein
LERAPLLLGVLVVQEWLKQLEILLRSLRAPDFFDRLPDLGRWILQQWEQAVKVFRT